MMHITLRSFGLWCLIFTINALNKSETTLCTLIRFQENRHSSLNFQNFRFVPLTEDRPRFSKAIGLTLNDQKVFTTHLTILMKTLFRSGIEISFVKASEFHFTFSHDTY